VARRCDVCCSPRRLEAERRCASGEAALAVARDLGLSRDSLRRHMLGHVAPALRQAASALGAVTGEAVVILPPSTRTSAMAANAAVLAVPTLESVATDLQGLKARAARILDDAEEAGAIHGRVAATGALVAVLDRLGRVAQLLAPPAPAAPTDTGAEVAAVILAELAALDPEMAQLLADRLVTVLDGSVPDAA
jgi:hypothetical protein